MSGAAATAGAAGAGRVDRRGISVLSCGHACVDMCQGAVPALIPFLIEHRGYSYASATALLLAMTVSSSLIQPLFGWLTDRRSLQPLLPLGLLTAGAGVAAIGLVDSYALTFLATLVSGVGVGAYHPEGARFANYVSGARRASGMSLYAVGGNIGFALGPILVTPLILTVGLGGTVWLLLPPLAMAAVLASEHGRLGGFMPAPAGAGMIEDRSRDRWWPFAGVATIAGLRSIAYFGLQAFVPVYFIHELGGSTALGNTALTVLLVAGAAGTLVGGRVADRIGTKAVLVTCMAAIPPLVLLFLVAGKASGIVLMGLTGFFAVGTFSITVVMGQQYLPSRIGMASGVTLGAAIGVGGITAYLLGVMADSTGLVPVMLVIAAVPLPAFAIAYLLPKADEGDVAEFNHPDPGSDSRSGREAPGGAAASP